MSTPARSGGAFISYRRQDTGQYARLLQQKLAELLGKEKVFIDVDSIGIGVDFVKDIERALAGCDVLIALIGSQWLTITGADGQRRLDDPDDLVRLEIKTALEQNVVVIPVLVDATPMPQPHQLPDGLLPLAHRNALELTNSRYDYDLGRLMDAVEKATGHEVCSILAVIDGVDELDAAAAAADARRLAAGGALPAGGRVLEGYSWGRLRPGSVIAGLWLLLAPFGLVNAAQFMLQRPTPGSARWAHTVAGAMLRLIGLALTALLVHTVTVVTLDLWAWQRVAATSGSTCAIALLGSLALLALVHIAVRTRPEAALNRPVPPPPPTRNHASELTRPGFFEGDADTPALRRLHVAAGLAVVALAATTTAAAWPGATWLWWATIVLIVLVTAGTVLMGDPEGSAGVNLDGRQFRHRILRPYLASTYSRVMVFLGSVAVSVAAFSLQVLPFINPTLSVHPSGINGIGAWVTSALVVGVLILVIANGVLARTQRALATADRVFRPYASGMACTLVTLIGVFLGVGYSGALTTVAARLLDTTGASVAVPDLFTDIVFAWGIAAYLLFGVVLIVVVISRQRSLAALMARAEQGFGADAAQRIPRHWIRRVAAAVWVARLKNRAAWLLAVAGSLGVLLSLPAAWQLAPTLRGRPPADLPWPLQLWTPTPAGTTAPLQVLLIGIGTITLSVIAATIVLAGRSKLLGESCRRGVNVIWDLLTFWPRSAHPWVPAAYSQRAVADIEERIRWHLTARADQAVVVCGHSQGSLLCFAALVRIAATGDPELKRIAFLTSGSQLQVILSRAFPAYVNLRAMGELFDDLGGRWRNLYRDTDALGGPVLSWDHQGANPEWVGGGTLLLRSARVEFGPDWRLLDPTPPVDATLHAESLLTLRGNAYFWLDPAWADAINELTRSVDPVADPTRAGRRVSSTRRR